MSNYIPSFYAAARGLWTLTWRSKLTRKRIIPILASMLALPIFAASVIDIDARNKDDFIEILINLYFFVVIPISCLFHYGAMIRDELQDDTMTFLITRPVSRAKIFLLKYVTLTLWVQMIALGNGLAFWAAGLWLEISDIFPLIKQLIITQAIAVIAFGALASFIGMLTQKYLIAGIVYGFIVEFGIAQIPTNINILSISHNLETLLARSVDLASAYDWSSEGSSFALAMILGGSILFLTMGALLFHFREFHHSDEMQKSS